MMGMTAKRWLLGGLGGLAALLLAGIGAWGCDGGSKWEHPNRERYPAPPAEEAQISSLEELQREWARQDRHARQLESPPAQPEQRRPPMTTLDLAAYHLRRAIDAAVDQTRLSTPPTESEPVGGGPPPDHPSDHERSPNEGPAPTGP